MDFLRRSIGALPVLLLSLAAYVSAQVTFDEKIAMVYDIAPKMRIMGSGFDTLQASNVKLSFAPSVKDSDYSLDISSSTVMTLSLKEGKKWVTVDPGSPPTRLYLSSVKNEGTTLTEETVQVATVVPAPTVQSSSREIYMKTTPKLVINGTNFNTKNTQLYFDPPLNEGTVIQKQILSSTQISITKIYKYDANVWAPEPGPLKVKGINTGGGILQLNPQDGGVIVAEVQADLEGHGVTINTHEAVDIYQSTKKLQIAGEGFKDGVKVRFATALRRGETNFTITETQPESITLELKDGSKWRKNVDCLPGPLVLLAANVGDGWVPLGPTAAKAGRNVATVFEDPSVKPSDIDIFRTHTHELMIKGTGFNKLARPIIDFHPPLNSNEVHVQVVDRTSIILSLSSTTSEWTTEDEVGPLTVKGIDTGAGMVKFDAPIQVANVVSDSEVHTSGVQVYPSNGEVRYQSSKQPLHIFGSGFKGEPVLSFEPPIWSPTKDILPILYPTKDTLPIWSTANYTLTVVSDTELKLVLAEGSLWNKYPGPLILKGINVGDGEVSLASGKGVKVATILETPIIKQADMHIYTTHTKHFPVRGTGFVSWLDPGKLPIVVVDGISSANFKIQENWQNGVMNLQLLHGPWSTLNAGETKHLKIMSINTGAGVVNFPGGIQIAIVREDSSSTLCDDSCAFAQDGQCDEPVQGSSRFPRSRRQRMSMSDDSFFAGMAPCEIGTDCTDCGVKVVVDGTCLNTCRHARDGFCDDPRAGGVCPGGTDCQDCGPWGDGNSNFTRTTTSSTTSWFDDDDWNLMVNDDGIKNQNVLFEIAQPRTGLMPLVMEE